MESVDNELQTTAINSIRGFGIKVKRSCHRKKEGKSRKMRDKHRGEN